MLILTALLVEGMQSQQIGRPHLLHYLLRLGQSQTPLLGLLGGFHRFRQVALHKMEHKPLHVKTHSNLDDQLIFL
jgi:hypothetical protein